MLRIDVLTIFLKGLSAFLQDSILKRAQEKKKVKVRVYDLRDFTKDRHRKVDDRPFGGGPGMVLMPGPIFDAVKKIKGQRRGKVLLMDPGGRPYRQKMAQRLSREKNLLIICGHYEGVDERVRHKLVDETISIGDYVLTGGELPALVVIDSIVRLIPGVLGRSESLQEESFEQNLLDFPHYTRPANFRGMKVPGVLLSGHHQEISRWRQSQRDLRTCQVRPDMLT